MRTSCVRKLPALTLLSGLLLPLATPAQQPIAEWAIGYCPQMSGNKFDCSRAFPRSPERGDYVRALFMKQDPHVAIGIPGTSPGKILAVGEHPVHKHIRLVKYEHDVAGTSTLIVSTYIAIYNTRKRELLGSFPFWYRVSASGSDAKLGRNMGERSDVDRSAYNTMPQPVWKSDARHIIVQEGDSKPDLIAID